MMIQIEPITAGDVALEACAALGARLGTALDPVPAGTHCVLAWQDGAPAARLSLGMSSELVGAPGVSGWVGHYEAASADAGVALLREAQRRVAAAGVARLLGPMHGDTWRRYRLALPPLEEPFLGEPRNAPDYPDHFRAAGFRVAAEYESRLELLADEAPATRPLPTGIQVRALRTDQWDAELRALHELSLLAFAENRYYAPISLAGFEALYAPLRAIIDPALVLLAHDECERLLGFVLAYPDLLDGAGGRRRVVLKTLATHPAARGLGLGSALTARIASLARERGAEALVHALMYVDNRSTSISAHRASRLLRRYALYEWTP